MKYVRVGFPFIVVLTIIANCYITYYNENYVASQAYMTAFLGWVIIMVDEIINFRKDSSNKDSV